MRLILGWVGRVRRHSPQAPAAVGLFGSALTIDRPWCGDSPFWVPSVAVLVVVVVVLGVPVAVVDVVEVVVV